MGKGLFIPQEIMGGLGNRGMQDFFVNFFLRRQNDVVSKESQTLFCPEEEMFETFPLKDKRESDFPKKLHHFAKGEKK